MAADPTWVTPLCHAQAIGMNFFELSSILWTSIISSTLYLHCIKNYDAKKVVDEYMPWYWLICIGIPSLTTTLPMVFERPIPFGFAGEWCWIDDAHDSLRFYFFYGRLLNDPCLREIFIVQYHRRVCSSAPFNNTV